MIFLHSVIYVCLVWMNINYRPQREWNVFTSVCLSTEVEGMPGLTSSGSHRSGQYASYFNAFLYLITVRNEVAKVMFLHVSVILFTGWGVLSQHALQVVSQHAEGCACSRGVPARGVPALGGRVPALGGGVETPAPSPQKQTATVADGTHPTGMHSCFNLYFVGVQNQNCMERSLLEWHEIDANRKVMTVSGRINS